MRQFLLAVGLSGSLAACSNGGSGPSAPPPPGCDMGASGFKSTCYSDPAPNAQATCAAALGTWLPGGCPGGTDLVGMCFGPAAGRVEYDYSSSFAFYATHDAAADCATAGGSFVPMGSKTSASCDFRPTVLLCADGTGTASDVEQGGLWRCSLGGGTLIAGPCPTAGRSGTCSYNDGYGIDVQERWYGTTTSVQAGCTSPKVWTP